MKDKIWSDETDSNLINFLLSTILQDKDNLKKETRKEIEKLLKKE